jgi:hypothetical protein
VGHTFNTSELIDRILDTLMSHLHAKNELRAWLLLDRVKDGAE